MAARPRPEPGIPSWATMLWQRRLAKPPRSEPGIYRPWEPSDVPDRICRSPGGLDAEDISVGKWRMCYIKLGRLPVPGGAYSSVVNVLSLPPDRGGDHVDTDIPLPLAERGMQCHGLDRSACSRYSMAEVEDALKRTGREILELSGVGEASKRACSLVAAHHHGSNCHLHFECGYRDEEEARSHVRAFKRVWDRRASVALNAKGLPCWREDG